MHSVTMKFKIPYYFIRESKEIHDVAASLRLDDQTVCTIKKFKIHF